jgi:hypothetical protein
MAKRVYFEIDKLLAAGIGLRESSNKTQYDYFFSKREIISNNTFNYKFRFDDDGQLYLTLSIETEIPEEFKQFVTKISVREIIHCETGRIRGVYCKSPCITLDGPNPKALNFNATGDPNSIGEIKNYLKHIRKGKIIPIVNWDAPQMDSSGDEFSKK